MTARHKPNTAAGSTRKRRLSSAPRSFVVNAGSRLRVASTQSHLQQADWLATGVGVTDPQPHPVAPADFTSASSAQQAVVPAGAGPPQQACGSPPCPVGLVAEPRFVVCD